MGVRWAPQPGSQMAFLRAGTREVLLEGNRGGGKTTALLLDFINHVGPRSESRPHAGFGEAWRGILFRRTHDALRDVIAKSRLIYGAIPGARFVSSNPPFWEFAGGERLYFRRVSRPEDADVFQGWEAPWLGWEELTTWPSPQPYTTLFAICRSPVVPERFWKVRATCNPSGPGHGWVKARFGLPVRSGCVVGDLITPPLSVDGVQEPSRRAIHSSLDENQILMLENPGYKGMIAAAARSDAQRRAWLHGDWNITAGGMFDDVWDPAYHVVPAFPVPMGWSITRAFDWGSSKPFSVGWWAESDGSDYLDARGRWTSSVAGDLYRIAEWYGSTGEPNVGLRMLPSAVAEGIVVREMQMKIRSRVSGGVADPAIFARASGRSVAEQMADEVLVDGVRRAGPRFSKVKGDTTRRVPGWLEMRQRFANAIPVGGLPRERPGLFVFDRCTEFVRTVPVLERDVANGKPDDVDTESEDHIADETRYRIRSGPVGSWSDVALGLA